MRRSQLPLPLLRATLVRHGALAALVAVVVSVLVSVGVVLFAQQDAYRSAERVGRQVADAVVVPLSRHEFGAPAVVDRGELMGDVRPFLASGMVHRVKVWTVQDRDARIVFSDEQQLEGETNTLPADTALRLAAGEVVAAPVPDDNEHRFETPSAQSLLEVFIQFVDAGGAPARLEVYVPIDEAATVRYTVAAVLPLVVGGVLVLALATLPFSVALAHRIERERYEQRAAHRYGLAAAERSRQELARHLHDGVIPDLAGARLLLDAVRTETTATGTPRSRQLLDDAHELVSGEVEELRTLLEGLVPIHPGDDLGLALTDLVEQQRAGTPGPHPQVDLDVAGTPGRDTAVVVHQVVGELVRNAFRHAAAGNVAVEVSSPAPGARVEVKVADDGDGFDPTVPTRGDQVGLLLVRRVVADHGGSYDVDSAPGAGTTIRISLPRSSRSA